MALSSSFELLSFQSKVNDALESVKRTLELERKPQLAADVDHTYGAKYGLVNLTSNASIIAYMNCFDKLGLDATVLKSIDKTKPVTLRFDSSFAWRFVKEVVVDVPANRTYEEKETIEHSDESKNITKSSVFKTVHHIKEYHWEVEANWSISHYSGTSVEYKKIIKSRAYKTSLITRSNIGMGSKTLPPTELSLTWLLQQIDTLELNSQFRVDTEDVETKTPRRNSAVNNALDFAVHLRQWCRNIEGPFFEHLEKILGSHSPALPTPQTYTMGQLRGIREQYSLFNPILPLMEETSDRDRDESNNNAETKSMIRLQNSNKSNDDHKTLLSSQDMSKLLNEQVRTLEIAVSGIHGYWPSESSDGILSSSEATLSLIFGMLRDLSTQYDDSMSYIEKMMENQLVAAIGKRLTPNDLDKFVKFHNARLLCPAPQPFSHAIRRPKQYPVGLLSIESHDGEHECIHSHSREVIAASNLKIPLSAATLLELNGQQYLHGYMNHRFGTSHKSHRLVARARQFSSFILVIGNMTDGSTLDPKDAIIVQNKDELLIPLVLEELPTAKEFKDAVESLSPEQQRFARAYRKMQLASSVFGVCVVQIKPQLETLLGLPEYALDKEMKLTQDLMELFVEYQVPSDLLSYSGFSENAAVEDKIANVRNNVKGVLDVINSEKEKQLKMEQAKTNMAMEKAFQGASSPSAFGSPAPAAGLFGAPTPAPDFCRTFGAPADSGGSFGASAPTFAAAFGARSPATGDLFDAPVSAPTGGMSNVNRKAGGTEIHQLARVEEKRNEPSIGRDGQAEISPDEEVDFTLIPTVLDTVVEKCGEGSALRSTTIKTGDVWTWTRSRQENLLAEPKRQSLNAEEVKKEKNKAFDLLDALSRSGSLPIAYNELHVIVALTHCFDKDVMSTVVCDNVNPIEKLENSTLLLASTVYGVPARELVRDASDLHRLENLLPLLLQPSENDHLL